MIPGRTFLLTLALAPMYGFMAVGLGLIAFVIGPSVEESLDPVITHQSVGDRWRTPTMACWNWTYSKMRSVTLVRQSFFVERDDGVRFPAAELRPDLGIPSNDTTTAKSGMTRTIPECVNVPPVLRATPRFRVIGTKIYRPWHRVYNLDQPVMSVVFDASVPMRAETLIDKEGVPSVSDQP